MNLLHGLQDVTRSNHASIVSKEESYKEEVITRDKYCKVKNIGAVISLDLITKLFTGGLRQSSRNGGHKIGGHGSHGKRGNKWR